jgi:hypothetical protein
MSGRVRPGLLSVAVEKRRNLDQRIQVAAAGAEGEEPHLTELLKTRETVAAFIVGQQRRRSLRWAVCIALGACLAAVLLAAIPRARAQTSIEASTAAVVATTNGNVVILQDSAAGGVFYQSRAGGRRWCTEAGHLSGCRVAKALVVDRLEIYPQSSVVLRVGSEGCLELQFLTGGGSLVLHVTEDGPKLSSEFPQLAAFDSVNVCAATRSLQLQDASYIAIADSTAEPPAQRRLLPASSSGQVVFANSPRTLGLTGAEIVELEDVQGSVISARLDKGLLSLHCVADAGRVFLRRGDDKKSAMPSLLDSALSSTLLRTLGGAMATIWALVSALRDRAEELF